MTSTQVIVKLDDNDIRVQISRERCSISTPQELFILDRSDPVFHSMIVALATDGVSEDELRTAAWANGDLTSIAQLRFLLACCADAGILLMTLRCHGETVATARRVPFFMRAPLSDSVASYRFSRFAYLRWERDEITIHSSTSGASITFHQSEVAKVVLCNPNIDDESDLSRVFLRIAIQAGIVVEVDRDGISAEDRDRLLSQWEFHDSVFHTDSRRLLTANNYGATFRFEGTIPPEPSIREGTSIGEPIQFPNASRKSHACHSAGFIDTLAARRSTRVFGKEPISYSQLGELLHHSARGTLRVGKDRGGIHRPYPSGGGLYELEIYLVIKSCQGLAPGIYWYHPIEHHLQRLTTNNNYSCEQMIRHAESAADAMNVQVLTLFAARFQRVSWKYERIAYSLILKDVGALMQTMYLVATALNLGACAIGAGDSNLFASATGNDPLKEASVGEMLIGSIPKTREFESARIEREY